MGKVIRHIGSGESEYIRRAYSGLSGAIDNDPAGLYLWVKKVTINNSLILDSDNGYDISFDIPFDDDAEINESTVTLYNLSATSLGQIQKDMPIIVEAGYKNDTSGQILNGKIISVSTYWEDSDKVTEITASDYNGTVDAEVKDISFTEKTPASQILQDLCNRLGVPIAVFQLARDYTFENSVKINGSLMDAIKKYAKVCGVHAWVNKSNLYVCALSVPAVEGCFNLTSDTGLLSVEEWQEDEKNEEFEDTVHGITATMLLQHRIYTGCTVQITSRNVNGQFKVREGSHVADDDEFTTTIEAIRM